jgi:uncharacterized protein YgbK (DUF1537 family)
MHNVLVIADDLTGAGEIAGIGHRYGLPTRLVRGQLSKFETGVTVVDTDSRLLSASDASEVVRRFLSKAPTGQYDIVYKKIDSALRGQILPELEALMGAFGRSAALVVPENPSRGRTVRAGEYRIDGALLQTTAFGNDPDYPARTSNVLQILGSSPYGRIACLDPGQEPMASGITIGAASTLHDVRHWAAGVHKQLVPAGGADFFQAILEQLHLGATRSFMRELPAGNTLFVCGSVSAYRRDLSHRAAKEGIEICPMPDRLFRGSSTAEMNTWSGCVSEALARKHLAVMLIPQKIDRSAGAGQRIQNALAQTVTLVLSKQKVTNVLLEGGATASAVCRKMGWHEFTIRGEIAAGVVQMRNDVAPEPLVIVKPGSYVWPDAVWAHDRRPGM